MASLAGSLWRGRTKAETAVIGCLGILLNVWVLGQHFRASADRWILTVNDVLALTCVLLACLLAYSVLTHRRLLRELDLRRSDERDARALAHRDPLTGLHNRRALPDIAERHQQLGGKRALLLCDLDGFKQINDTHGHKAGDAMLHEIAERLAALRYDRVAIEAVRLGGDEFVLLAAGAELDSSGMARDILRIVSEPVTINQATMSCSVSIGIATSQGGESLDDLLSMADDAMYDAKRSGLPVRTMRSESAMHASGARRLFEQQIDMRVTERTLYAAAIGIDRLREMRRALGYGLGSKLMRELTQRLGQLDDRIFFERLSSDVLGIAFFAANRDEARATLETLRNGAEGQITLSGETAVDLRLTIGLAGPGGTLQVRDLAEQSQAALEDAWRTGARLRTFEQSDLAAASENIGLMSQLRDAIRDDQLELHYQPKVRLATSQIESIEALVRWNHPVLGSIPPSRFIPVAEKTGDVRELTEWVIDRVLADRESLLHSVQVPPIFVNVSADLISDENFAAALLHRLASLEGAIGIEITETAVLANPERALPHLNKLADVGVQIAIDDYGVGLSSLAYLKQLPATELKLDMMFITNLATSHRDPMIVRSTIELAHGLGLIVTAEGVDDMDAYALLKVMGCDLVQGFAIAKPMPVEGLIDLLSEDGATRLEALGRAAAPFPFARRLADAA